MTRSAARRANRNAYRLLLVLSIEECDFLLMKNGPFDADSARRFARREESAHTHWMQVGRVNWPLVAERMNRDGMRSVQAWRIR